MNRNFLRAALALSAPLALACGSSSNVTVTPIAAGTQCPNGGFSISVNNGAPSIVCNGAAGSTGATGSAGASGSTGGTGATGSTGASGYTTLIKTTSLPSGDANCPNGGERIDSGLDNGAGGGIANDGILQPGEITETFYVCDGAGPNVGSLTPPTGAPGSSTVHALGGAGADGGGGTGNTIAIAINDGTEGGHVRIFQTGAADPSFSFPPKPAADLGSNPVILNSSASVGVYESDAGPGTLYTDENGNLYVIGADGGAPVTGLAIDAGVTLTGPTNGTINVNGPCINSGTLTLPSGDTATLSLTCSAFYGDPGSQILNDGVDGGPETPDTLPSVVITNGSASGGINLAANAVWNQGLLEANGGNGGNGGNAGSIDIYITGNGQYSNGTPIFNTGAINAIGGSGISGGGGNGGGVQFSGGGDVNNMAAINAQGGSGTTAGGAGGSVDIYAGDDYTGSFRNGGAVTTSGGSVAAGCTAGDGENSCAGGSGGSIYFYAGDGLGVNNAALIATGGSSPAGPAGGGGSIGLYIYSNNDTRYAESSTLLPSGDLDVSGDLDASGGAGLIGGGAGSVYIQYTSNAQPNGQQVTLYGYSELNSSGGAGTTFGGGAGFITVSNTYFNPQQDDEAVQGGEAIGPGGSVVNYANLYARGGAGPGSSGGSGGQVTLFTQTSYFFPNADFERVLNFGSVDGSGGAGATGGTPAGIYFNGRTSIANSGTLTCQGGLGSSTPGSPGQVQLLSDTGPVSNSATINTSGPSGAYGVNGGIVVLAGYATSDSGSINASGGSSSASTAPGGSGAVVNIISSGGGLSTVTATAPGGISVAGGASSGGGATGADGQVLIDNWDVTTSWTH